MTQTVEITIPILSEFQLWSVYLAVTYFFGIFIARWIGVTFVGDLGVFSSDLMEEVKRDGMIVAGLCYLVSPITVPFFLAGFIVYMIGRIIAYPTFKKGQK